MGELARRYSPDDPLGGMQFHQDIYATTEPFWTSRLGNQIFRCATRVTASTTLR
jgi:hypothetical protein